MIAQAVQVQARPHGVAKAAGVGVAVRRDRRRAGHHNARMDAAHRLDLTVQPWQVASLPELLQIMEQAKTAPILQEVAR